MDYGEDCPQAFWGEKQEGGEVEIRRNAERDLAIEELTKAWYTTIWMIISVSRSDPGRQGVKT